MRRSLGRKPAVLAPLAGLLLLACGGLEPARRPAHAPAARADIVAEAFSSERAWAHVQALAALGPRPPGSAASQAANEYLRTRLEALGLEVEEVEIEIARPAEAAGAEAATLALRHLVARVPGDSPDPVLLLAHYDTSAESPGANDGASGPALLLELARQLVERPLPYRTELWFLDGEVGAPPGWPELPPLTGSRQLVRAMADRLDALRLVVAFRRVAGAQLTIGRDRFSDAASREEFFRVARRLGHGAAFPSDRGYVEVPSSGRVFWDAGHRRVVSILGPGSGDEDPAGAPAGGAGDTPERCSPESLQTVGEVSLVTLRRLAERLRKVDRLTGRDERRPREPGPPPEAPEPSEAPPESS